MPNGARIHSELEICHDILSVLVLVPYNQFLKKLKGKLCVSILSYC